MLNVQNYFKKELMSLTQLPNTLLQLADNVPTESRGSIVKHALDALILIALENEKFNQGRSKMIKPDLINI